VNDGGIVGVEPLPSRDVIQYLRGGRCRNQQGGVDFVLVEHAQQFRDLASLDGIEEVDDEFFTVELGAAVDEGRHAHCDQIAPEFI
jgi:hypothetical protein